MKTEVNTPARSKINWTALGIQMIGVLVISGLIPTQYEKPLVEITLILGPALIQLFRTYFTRPQ